MSLEILQDKRVRSVEWKDLLSLSKWEIFHELHMTIPWFLLAWFFAYIKFYPLALIFSFLFFLVGLRQGHNAFHYALGVSKPISERVLVILGILMLCSMHAIKANHLHHHKCCLSDDDLEGSSAKMEWWQAIFFGPMFYFKLHINGFKIATKKDKAYIFIECVLCFLVLVVVIFFFPHSVLLYHLGAMITGQFLTAFFAVWTVHHHCDDSHFIARTIRNKIKSSLTFNMFYHVEHHLYPKVPTCHLPELSRRLDQHAPELSKMRVI
ncbi:MAG: fatty acid desaturase [Planctomycetota bacterium]|nr:MAG: fatty acid desaturase [Planctomycetota bacterium]